MIDNWKIEMLKTIGLDCIVLNEEEWIMLLMAVDGYSPIIGEEVFHTCFFLYPYVSFSFKPLFLSVYAEEVSSAIERLKEKGLVKLEFDYSGQYLREVYKLTSSGRGIADKLLRRVKSGWIVFRDILVRSGGKVLDELTALKKTYNGRGPAELLKLVLNQLNSTNNIFRVRFNDREISYLKKIYRSYKE